MVQHLSVHFKGHGLSKKDLHRFASSIYFQIDNAADRWDVLPDASDLHYVFVVSFILNMCLALPPRAPRR